MRRGDGPEFGNQGLNLLERAVHPAALVSGPLPGWQFPLYTLLTISAFLVIGIGLHEGGFPTWSAWLLMGGESQ